MKVAVFVEPGKVAIREMEKPVIQKPTDAIIRIVRACVCGSDLWWYRGISTCEPERIVGHEAIGVVIVLPVRQVLTVIVRIKKMSATAGIRVNICALLMQTGLW